MIKRYVSLNSLHLITSVVVDKMVAVIEFKGGRMTPEGRINGTFTTDNSALQKAIESDPNYGRQFILSKTGGEKGISAQPQESQSNYVQVLSVKNRQNAIEWISANLNIEVPKSMSSRGIRHVAQERGFVFENWN